LARASLLLGLIWFARAEGSLSPGEVVTRDIWVLLPLQGWVSMREPFGDLVLQECKSFGSTSSSTSPLSSQSWSNGVKLDIFLHLVDRDTEREENGWSLGFVYPHCTLCHALLTHTCWRTLQPCLGERKCSASCPARRRNQS